jgi:hypothetical protein
MACKLIKAVMRVSVISRDNMIACGVIEAAKASIEGGGGEAKIMQAAARDRSDRKNEVIYSGVSIKPAAARASVIEGWQKANV